MPLDREAKVRIMHLARALKHKTEPGKHYGVLTGKFVDVLHAMLWLIHDGRSGQCNPSYSTISDKAGCAMSTVCEAIKALEAVGVLSWANRIARERTRECDLFGQWSFTWRVIRTSNAYVFHDPKTAEQKGRPSNTDFRSGPPDTDFKRGGARLDGAQVMQGGPSQAPPVRTRPPDIALRREQAAENSGLLSDAERAALTARLATKPTKADWDLCNTHAIAAKHRFAVD